MGEENFADAPVTLTAVRAEKERDASKWTPRDALVDVLRRVDKGELRLSHTIICYRETQDGDDETYTSYVRSGSDCNTTIGILERVKYMILEHGQRA